VAIQVLNYDKILARQERIVSIDREGDTEFVRFYDFLPGGNVRFNLLQFGWEETGSLVHSFTSVILRPYTRQELVTALAKNGFQVALEAGGGKLDAFNAETSDTLLLIAKRRPRLPQADLR